MSVGFNHLVLAKQAYLHSLLSLLVELLVVSSQIQVSCGILLSIFIPVYSHCLILRHPTASCTCFRTSSKSVLFFLQDWQITKAVCNSCTIGNMCLPSKKGTVPKKYQQCSIFLIDQRLLSVACFFCLFVCFLEAIVTLLSQN